jgi:hypothetical protein
MKVLVITVLLTLSSSVIAANPCAGVSTTLSATEKRMYARSVSSSLTNGATPAQIKIEKAISLKNWTAVWATPKDMEQGIFFYSQEKSGLKFHDVWGGFALPSDKPDIVRWIEKLSASIPDDFAECAAETIAGGH